MGLLDTVKSAYVAAIGAADDTVHTVTYRVVIPGVYDPATDNNNETFNDYVVEKAFFYGLNDMEMDWFPADWNVQKWLVHQDDIGGVTPKSEDRVIKDLETWQIQRIKVLPGETVFILYLTRS